MNKLIIFFALFVAVVLVSCNTEKKKTTDSKEIEMVEVTPKENANTEFITVGEEISEDGALGMAEIEEKYANLKPGDTINLKMKSTVNEVCVKKGCWMKLEHGQSEDIMVKMKDYAFFVPKDIQNKEVVVSGKAYVTEMSVEDQKHYAEDGGKSEDEIAAINQPKRTFSFMADGVLIKE